MADLLARHYSAAQDVDLAWRYARLAAQRARAAYANEEAATHYEQALDAVRRLPDVPDAEKAAMWSGLGDAREQLGMFAEAIDAYRRAEAARAGRPDGHGPAGAAARPGQGAERRVHRGVAGGADGRRPPGLRRHRGVPTVAGPPHRVRGDRPSGPGAAARKGWRWPSGPSTEAETAGERFALAQAYSVIDWALIVLGRAGEAVLAQRALAIFEELGDLSRQAAALNNLGAAAYFSGDWTAAIAYYERSAEASRRSGNEVQAALGAMNTGELLVNQGRLDEAEPILQEALRVLQASGSDAAHFAEMQFGRVALERGDLRLAERLMTHAQQDAAAIGQWESAREAAIHLARCHLRRGDPAQALETLRAAQRTARGEAALYDVLAAEVETMILIELDLLEEARGVYEAAVADARRQGLVFELALLLLAGAAIDARAGTDPDPLAVDEAVTILTELGCEARLASQLGVAAG